MLKAVFAATAAVTIATSTAAYAQRDGRGDDFRNQPTTEDIRAFQAAHLAALRAGLVLNAEQEKHWPAFEQAMRELQQQRLNRITARREARRQGRPVAADPVERMRQRATRLMERGTVLKRLADATDPLYRSLDDAQKRRFAVLSRMAGPPGGGMWRWRGREGGDPAMPRGQRRTGLESVTPAPQIERLSFGDNKLAFGDKAADGAAVVRDFGGKWVIERAALLASKTITGDLALGGAKLTTGEGRGASRKITIGEPTAFGRKLMQGI